MLYNLKLRLTFIAFDTYLSIQSKIEKAMSTLDQFRDDFINKMFSITSYLYLKYARLDRKAWGITQQNLQYFPEESLGKILFNFLQKHNFTIQPRAENHDIFHIVSGYPPEVKAELGLQFLLFGNGKRSVYMFIALFTALLITPDKWKFYLKSYKKGKSMRTFYDWDFEYLLNENIHSLQDFLQRKEVIPSIEI